MLSPEVTRGLAVLLLAALAVWPLARFLYFYRFQTRYPWTVLPLYLTYWFFAKLRWRCKVSRPLPLPAGQGAVIVSNHVSSIDPWFIQLGVNQIVHWMVAREYALHPKLAWLFRSVGSIPVNRSGVDTSATKMAIRLARGGGLVGLFPEGRINTDPNALLGPGRQGAALIALKARVPVIPCFIKNAPYDGTEFGCFFMTAKTELIVGDPIDLTPYLAHEDDRAMLDELTLRFMKEIAHLAGDDDFEPHLAGRTWVPKDRAPTWETGSQVRRTAG